MSNYQAFRDKIKVLLQGDPEKAKEFQNAVGSIYGQITPNEEYRDDELTIHLKRATGQKSHSKLGRSIKTLKSKNPPNSIELSCALFYLAYVEDHYTRALFPIEKVLFGSTDNNRITFDNWVERTNEVTLEDEISDDDLHPADSKIGIFTRNPDQRSDLQLYSYAYSGEHKIKVLGREKEQAALRRFLHDDMKQGFLWLQIAGVAGQGKSRLGWDLIQEVNGNGWAAGFWNVPKDFGSEDAKSDFLNFWKCWTPNKPHLLVLDYVVALGSVIGPVMESFMKRSELFQHPVRVLLLERQRWDQGGLVQQTSNTDQENFANKFKHSNEYATWFNELNKASAFHELAKSEFLFEKTGILELRRLTPADLAHITRDVFKASNNGQALFKPDATIEINLQKIDKEGRPLYAFFLGNVLSNNNQDDVWTKGELLTFVLDKDQNQRWSTFFDGKPPSLNSTDIEMKAAVLATLSGGCTLAQLRDILGDELDDDSLCKSLVLVNGPSEKSSFGPAKIVPPLLPDILGEWFVLNALELRGTKSGNQLIQQAWGLSPTGMSQFIERAASDFPTLTRVTGVLKPPSENDLHYKQFVNVSAQIAFAMSKADEKVPDAVITAIQIAADHKDDKALNILGYMLWTGKDIAQNFEKSTSYFKISAEHDNPRGMSNYGLSLSNGTGVDKDPAQANEWYTKAAEAGDATAMVNLGLNYENGTGIDKDPAQANEWYRKAAEAGDATAMRFLGVNYVNGRGVNKNPAQAIEWYTKATEVGDAIAMRFLGLSYLFGTGVDKDPAQANEWYTKAAEAGDATAMVNLGIIYANGTGIDENIAQANMWFKKA
ncbi:MAG: SEL1-like repeat protein, partial [Cohaesibacteraceae bacterium]|nr:SEL1-like repeat protein [Cohaesibacteraceae bacterium]